MERPLCDAQGVVQTAYHLTVSSEDGIAADTGRVESDESIEPAGWIPVLKADYPMDNLVGQSMPPVRPVKVFEPERVFTAHNGDIIIDAGQVLAGWTGDMKKLKIRKGVYDERENKHYRIRKSDNTSIAEGHSSEHEWRQV